METKEITIKDITDKLWKIDGENYPYINKILEGILSKQKINKARENKNQTKLK